MVYYFHWLFCRAQALAVCYLIDTSSCLFVCSVMTLHDVLVMIGFRMRIYIRRNEFGNEKKMVKHGTLDPTENNTHGDGNARPKCILDSSAYKTVDMNGNCRLSVCQIVYGRFFSGNIWACMQQHDFKFTSGSWFFLGSICLRIYTSTLQSSYIFICNSTATFHFHFLLLIHLLSCAFASLSFVLCFVGERKPEMSPTIHPYELCSDQKR